MIYGIILFQDKGLYMEERLSQIFKKNRAEEFPDDLWGKYVLPLNYAQFNLLNETKGVKVVGGRGTGKTMYLKYHAYHTQLSKKRLNIDESDINTLGVYWKPDTHFVQLINEDYIGEKWEAVFNTYVALSFLMKFTGLIDVFLDSNYNDYKLKDDLRNFILPSEFTSELNLNKKVFLIELKTIVRGSLFKLQNWLHNPKSDFHFYLDGKATIEYLIQILKDNAFFQNTKFHIFIDEFENLREEHQKIINTWMKHGENPLLFSVAYKKHAYVTDETTSKEHTQRRNDHRIIDLVDDLYARTDDDFKLLSAEIIATKIQEYIPGNDIIDQNKISDINQLDQRRSPEYKNKIIDFVNSVLPSLTYKEIANQIFSNKTLKSKLIKNIDIALKTKNSLLSSASFYDDNFPEASLVNGTLLFRSRTKPEDLYKLFEEYKTSSKSSSVQAYKEQISNVLVGSILYIYISFPQRICPIYAGFERFCLMSRSNLRHLLELCYQSFVELENSMVNANKSMPKIPQVAIELQAKASKFCSRQELDTISELGPYGQDLQKIANRLGIIFSLKQKIRTQSKPENIHFSVETHAIESIDKKIKTLLYEAKLWNVLQEFDETTKDSPDNIATKEFMLTPILAPYYKISMRKIHKIVFTLDEIKIIFLSSDIEFDKLYKKFVKDWKIEDAEDLGLFGETY